MLTLLHKVPAQPLRCVYSRNISFFPISGRYLNTNIFDRVIYVFVITDFSRLRGLEVVCVVKTRKSYENASHRNLPVIIDSFTKAFDVGCFHIIKVSS